MIRLPSLVISPRSRFLPAIDHHHRRTNALELRRRATKARLRARTLCTVAAIQHRRVHRVAGQLRLLKLKAFYAQLPEQLLLVPIGGAQGSHDDMVQIKLDLLSDLNVLTAHGEIDLANIHVLEETLNQLDEALPLLLDFTGVRYMDSAAVHILFRTCDRHDIWHTPVALVTGGIIHRICMLAGLQTRLRLFADAMLAQQHFAVGRQRASGNPG
jgi:anti-anti-sigma factor